MKRKHDQLAHELTPHGKSSKRWQGGTYTKFYQSSFSNPCFKQDSVHTAKFHSSFLRKAGNLSTWQFWRLIYWSSLKYSWIDTDSKEKKELISHARSYSPLLGRTIWWHILGLVMSFFGPKKSPLEHFYLPLPAGMFNIERLERDIPCSTDILISACGSSTNLSMDEYTSECTVGLFSK